MSESLKYLKNTICAASYGLAAIILFIGTVGCQSALGGLTLNEAFPDSRVQALVNAALEKNVSKARSLVQEGADPNYVGTDGVTPLAWVTRVSGQDWDKVEVILQVGASPNAKFADGDSIMFLAAGGNRPKYMELLIKYGGDPNITGHLNTPAIEEAALYQRLENIKALLKSGADINAHDAANGSAATAASGVGAFDIVVFLLAQGYSHDLTRLAISIESSRVSQKDQQCEWKKQAVDMLKDRGVKFPASTIASNAPPRTHDPCLPAWHTQNWQVEDR